MEIKELQLINTYDFQKEFAPSVGIASIRALFQTENFPGMKIGNKYYTTMEAARRWLSTMGKTL
jgi:hypothetical protein